MARWRILPLVVLLGTLVASGQVAAARPTSSGGTWRGRTSQHLPLSFHVSTLNGHRVIDQASFEFDVPCPSGIEIGAGVGIFGPIARIRGGSFGFADTGPFDAISWSGTVSRVSASGEVAFALPAFDSEGVPQRCDTGTLGWAALRDGQAVPAPSGPTVHVSYVMDASGAARVTISEG